MMQTQCQNSSQLASSQELLTAKTLDSWIRLTFRHLSSPRCIFLEAAKCLSWRWPLTGHNWTLLVSVKSDVKTIFYSLELTSKEVSRYHDHHGFCYFWTLAAWRRFQCNLDLRLQTLEVDDALHPSFMLCRTWFLMFFFISNICLLEGIVSVNCIC